jgi:protein-disulfide isomerase
MNDNLQPSSRGFFDGNPKMLFVFGLVSGIALTLVLSNFAGVAIAAPGNGGNGGRTVTTTTPTPTNTGGTAPSGQLAAATDDDHVRGGDIDKADVVIIEYSDFECPFCSRHHPTMLQVMEEYGDKVAWVYRHFPLSFHPEAKPAALASECAAEQGKFWEYADALFENQTLLADGYYATLAGELGLNANKFNDCFDSAKYQAVVDADTASGAAAGVNGTPATFINGQLVSGAVPFASLKTIIDAELAK